VSAPSLVHEVHETFASGLDKEIARTKAPDVKTWPAIDLFRAEGLPESKGLLGEHVLCPESVALVVGEGGVGKTILMLLLGRHVAAGEKFEHLDVRCTDVLFLSEEMPEAEMRQRLRAIFTEKQLEELGKRLKIRCRSGIRIDIEAGIEKLRHLIEVEGCPGLVIIDALCDVHLLDENSNRDMGQAFKRIRDDVATPTGACIAIIHHAGKPNEFTKGANKGRGASAMRDVAADVITIEKAADGWRLVSFAKVRHGEEPAGFKFKLGSDEHGKTTLEIGTGTATSELKATGRLLKLLRQNGGAMTPPDLKATAMAGSPPHEPAWSKATYDRHRKAAKETGYIVLDESVSPAVYRPAKVD
jgi:hypothetical protein